MIVAFDLRPLQSGHQFRGIGITLQNILKELMLTSSKDKKWEFVYYVYDHQPLPKILKNQNLDGRIIKVHLPKTKKSRVKILSRAYFLMHALTKLNSVNHLPELDKIDVFVQFDFLFGLPKKTSAKKILVKYDVIPLIMPHHYLPSFSEVKSRTNSRKVALKAQLSRWRYLYSLKTSLRRSDLIMAISEQTKKDLEQYMSVPAEKIKIMLLAADKPSINQNPIPAEQEFQSLNWQFIKTQKHLTHFKLNDAPYILYIGGGDPRRRIQDLITVFNHIRASGINCRLILVGFDFENIENIPNDHIKEAIRLSSYGDSLYLLGFVDEQQKAELYKNAAAFIYPSIYEGFGLPILEAMEHNCPVICYDNSSLREVGGKAALYASSFEETLNTVSKLLTDKNYKDQVIAAGRKQAELFTWQKTAATLRKAINEI